MESGRRTGRAVMLAAALTVGLASASTAQDATAEQPRDEDLTEVQQIRHLVGGAPRFALTTGFGDGSAGGFGIEGTVGIRLGDSPVWIRGDAGLLDLGETLHTSGGSTSGNSLLTLLVGPEIEVHRGTIRPFLHLIAGYVRNMPSGDVSPAETNGSAAFGLSGGVRVRLSSAARPALLEAGLRFTNTGELSFALGEDTDSGVLRTYELRLGVLLGLP